MHAVTYIGYWAYGSSASSYLLNNVSGPIWLKGMANIAAFLQAIIALHVIITLLRSYNLYTFIFMLHNSNKKKALSIPRIYTKATNS